jgi:predicted metal-binding protein
MSYEFMDLTQHETDVLLAVATLYVDAFDDENEMMTLPERMSLQEVEKILDRHGRRY